MGNIRFVWSPPKCLKREEREPSGELPEWVPLLELVVCGLIEVEEIDEPWIRGGVEG